MAAFLVCSLAVPTAFGDSGLAFALAYLVVVLVHAAGFLAYNGSAALGPVSRVLPWNLVSTGLLFCAAWAHGTADWILWTAVVLVQLISPMVIRVGVNFNINAAHFAELHGLVILIVLGESLVSVGLASEHERVDMRLAVGVLAGLLGGGHVVDVLRRRPRPSRRGDGCRAARAASRVGDHRLLHGSFGDDLRHLAAGGRDATFGGRPARAFVVGERVARRVRCRAVCGGVGRLPACAALRDAVAPGAGRCCLPDRRAGRSLRLGRRGTRCRGSAARRALARRTSPGSAPGCEPG